VGFCVAFGRPTVVGRSGAGRVLKRTVWHDGWWSPARRCASPNFDDRPCDERVRLAVIHSISLPPGRYGGDEVERFFTNRLDHAAHPYFAALSGVRVSAHFFIRRDGEIWQFVSCDRRAWHAGVSSWAGSERCNDFSIGIELEGLEGERFERAQYNTLARLLRSIARRYPIEAVVGHQHIAPERKGDPGAGFNWRMLRMLLRWHLHALAPVEVPCAIAVRYR
jgi:N-acetyl-anhydromuramoyl-L-alanine amidase